MAQTDNYNKREGKTMEERQNLTQIDSSIFNSQKGYGNQLISCGILLRLGYEASLAETVIRSMILFLYLRIITMYHTL
jgi:hypothetical protein